MSSQAPTSYLITGASRGLGLELTRQLLLASPQHFVIAAARDPASSVGLLALAQEYGVDRLQTVKMDVTSEGSVASAVQLVEKMDPVAQYGLDVLIHSAGVFAGGHASFSNSTLSELTTNLSTNLYGPISVTTSFLPLLRRGRGRKIFLISSSMGSLGGPMGETPFSISYSISKSALNMFSLKLARELSEEGFTVVPFHPGYVKTDMNGGPEGPAALTVEESISLSLQNVIFKATLKDSGTFMVYDGSVMPW
ncbi:dehydrogenase [Leucosporidium creatinivorum]|uniref:Dehydrogenase n=1 Tax=Leucosporidium creatinivorum TaxID=106004 RepID=A0A1Y2EDD4_9BASI|nr:dehydrogenase [Leucosporidium creatinivorum]